MDLNQLLEGAVSRALDDLFHDDPGHTLTRVRVEHVMRILAQRAATHGANVALLSLMSTAQVAETLEISTRRVRALARARGLGKQIGRDWIFTPADVDAMRVRIPGRPSE